MSKVLNYYKGGCCIPEGAVYIGRGNPSKNLPHSKFANPFKIKEGVSREAVIQQYRVWLWSQIVSGKITKEELLELAGKDLVCFCAPQRCHGDVLLKAIEWVLKEK